MLLDFGKMWILLICPKFIGASCLANVFFHWRQICTKKKKNYSSGKRFSNRKVTRLPFTVNKHQVYYYSTALPKAWRYHMRQVHGILLCTQQNDVKWGYLLIKEKSCEKDNQTPHCGRDKGIQISCRWFAKSTTRHASSLIANDELSDWIPLIADLFLFCYERDFISNLQKSKQYDFIYIFNDPSRYLGDIFIIDNPELRNIFHTVNLDIFASIYFCEFKQKAYRFIFVLLIFANSFKCWNLICVDT